VATTSEDRSRSLKPDERRSVVLLGIPTFALALAVTIVTTYLPVVAKDFIGSSLVIGLIIGIEGMLAIWLPLVAGSWSDRLKTRLGGRLPFVIAGTPFLGVGLVAMGFVGSLLPLVVAALVFFVGYFLAYEPYRALYPDLFDDEVAGRAQGTQALWRGGGTGIALLGGGLLLSLSRVLPFIAAAVVATASTVVLTVGMMRRGDASDESGEAGGGAKAAARRVWELVRESPPLRSFLVANALWELSLGAIKTFVVLYVTIGLGYSRATAALLIGGAAVLILFAAMASGRLADKVGKIAVLKAGLPLYGFGLLVPLVFTSPLIIACAVPFIAIGGGAIMALPYAVLMPLMPDEEHGTLTGVYSFSRGMGVWLGPLIAGLVITLLSGVLKSTQGYQATWGVCAIAILASLPFVRKLDASAEEDIETDAAESGS
jgi:MFS family permease